MAASHGSTSLVFTFDYPPEQWFKRRIQLLTDQATKKRLILAQGIDEIVSTRFNQEFAEISAERFVVDILLEQLQAQVVICGFDYRFGHRADGDTSLLQEIGNRYGFAVRVIPPVIQDNQPISSSRIRMAIQEGKVEIASELLGRHHGYVGKVVAGKQLGRKLGFPTANITVDQDLVLPKPAAYLTWCFLNDGANYPAMTSVSPSGNIESHLFEYDGNLYQQTMEVLFLQKMRDWLKFTTKEELQHQLGKDYEHAQALLAKYRLQGHEIVLK